MSSPQDILASFVTKATGLGINPAVTNAEVLARIDYVCRCLGNRAGVRLLMSSMLAKIHQPVVDPRKPYTEIGGSDCFSGRTYDERYLTEFITRNHLPCNNTTAFLTPALRNQNTILTKDKELVGRPPQVYVQTLQLLDDVVTGKESAENVLVDTIRILIQMRDEKKSRMDTLTAALRHGDDALPLASEAIVTLLQQHLACKHSSRLPVLIIAAAYTAAANWLGERALPLNSHNAADEQTGAGGDVEVCLVNDENVVTIYEMKSKRVTRGNIDRAIHKICQCQPRIHNYVFITTDVIESEVREYASSMYEETNGTEIAILDCIGFIRHFLHFFHRLRIQFLDAYQSLVLAEPDSAVKQPLKEAFLSLRQAAESDE